MSKIVQAINAMIAFKEKITNVRRSPQPDEYFFSYNQKYSWSIGKYENADEFYICNYPLPFGMEVDDFTNQLAQVDPDEFGHIDYVNYNTRELKTREAKESFGELYNIVKGKLLGINNVLDDIIKDAEVPF